MGGKGRDRITEVTVGIGSFSSKGGGGVGGYGRVGVRGEGLWWKRQCGNDSQETKVEGRAGMKVSIESI